MGYGWLMMLSIISVISWQSDLLAEENRIPGEYHRLAASYWQILSQSHI